MYKALLALVILAAGIALYIRVAPSDPSYWHVDPRLAEDPGAEGILHKPGPEAKTYPVTPQALIKAVDALARSEPRVKRLAGSVAEAHITYIARSKVMGFPDYITIMAVEAQGGAQLAVYSRLRFGGADLGVNAARWQAWLAKLDAALG